MLICYRSPRALQSPAAPAHANTMVALAKFIWVKATYGSEPSVEFFTKNYCLP
jgi:hypothetical protein